MSHRAVPVHYDWSVMAQRVLFQRTRIAFEAARENGIDGTFLVSESHGLLVAMTTAQGLGFLNTVTILDDASVAELPGILQEFRTAGIGDPTIVVPDDDPARAAVLESLGLQPVGTRPLAFLGLQPGLPYPRPAGGETLRIRPVETHQDHALLIDILLAGYGASPEVARFIQAEHSSAAVKAYLAWLGDEPIAGAATSWHAGGIVLGGAATVETHRGLGAQTALLHARLADVARSDPATTGTMTLATATAAPDSPSLRNLKRAHVIVRLRHAWRAGAST